jgi:hypothetical protein
VQQLIEKQKGGISKGGSALFYQTSEEKSGGYRKAIESSSSYIVTQLAIEGDLSEAKLVSTCLEIKPTYAPCMVKAWLRGNEGRMVTAEKISMDLDLPLKQVRVILQRMTKDKEVHRMIRKSGNQTVYYWRSPQLKSASHHGIK